MESPTHPETETAEPGPWAFASLGEGARLGQMAGVVPDHSAPWPWPQAGLGECAQLSGPGLTVAPGTGAPVTSLETAGSGFSLPIPDPPG